MFITILTGSLAAAAALIQLGAISVKLSVITLAFKVALGVIAMLIALVAAMLFWQRPFKAR
jgi:hypothetical protein